MQIIAQAHNTTFRIDGESFETIAKLTGLPAWALESYHAWQANATGEDFVIHIAPGQWLAVLPEEPLTERGLTRAEESRFDKLQKYSDYHKDFYGYRPTEQGMTEDDVIAAYDAIAEKHRQMLATPDGRRQLRAIGWIADEPEDDTRSELGRAVWGADN